MTNARPPRFARWFLNRVLPADMREDVTGDLEEMFRSKRSTLGSLRACAWYYWMAILFPIHLLAERLRQRRGTFKMTPGISWIDFKLALRMLLRNPGLTLVGVLAMAAGITVSAGAFSIGHSLLDPSLPFEDGDRIVALEIADIRTQDREPRILHDFLAWRGTLSSVEQLGAFRIVGRTLVAEGAQPESIPVAEISASGFPLARVAPLLGRHLLPEDERSGAPEVVVIREDLWRRRFNADPTILGRTIRLGTAPHTVVGVMPASFGFPVSESVWIPLRLPASAEPLTGPSMTVFARLAPGATIESAQTELTAHGARATTAYPATHEHLRPHVVPYTHAFTDMGNPENALAMRLIQTLVVLVLVLVSVNVAILVYARTATRQGEIAVRAALGASRRRIVSQLFLEALALASVSALVAIVLLSVGLRQLEAGLLQITGGGLPFWLRFGLSPAALGFIVALTFLAAAIVGIVPALKATGRRVQARLQGLSAGSGSRMQMGRLWTVLIVAQVAVAVAILPATVYHSWNSLRFRSGDRGFAAREFVTTELLMERSRNLVPTAADQDAFRVRYGTRQAELERLIENESAAAGVTFSLTNPGEELAMVLEAEGVAPPVDPVDYNIVAGSKQGYLVRFNRIAVDFFPAFDVPVLLGRGFGPADTARVADRVLVNRAFVNWIFGGGSPLGRRVRYVGRSREAGEHAGEIGRWYEIVGVVSDFPPYAQHGDGSDARIYHAAAPGDVYPTVLAIRLRGIDPASFAPRLREISGRVDAALQLKDVSTADDVIRREQGVMRLIGATLAGLTVSIILLAAAGIYALMSFTVARRRKEIGIRAALGADPARILASIFSRALGQLAVGATLGMLGAIGLESLLEGEAFQGKGVIVLPAIALFTTVVGLLAAWGPARRGLQIQPMEALRED